MTAFDKMLPNAIDNMKNDANMHEFGIYFEKEYKSTAKNWAYCYRKWAGVNTNMALERLHGIIRHLYLKEKKPKTLDIALQATNRLIRDKMFEYIIQMKRGKLTAKVSAI